MTGTGDPAGSGTNSPAGGVSAYVSKTQPPKTDVPKIDVHATCIVVHEAGILIRGEAGSGKSTLALALLDRAAGGRWHASLVGDDRIGLARHHGRIVATGHPALAGLLEIRGLGLRRIVRRDAAAVIRLVVDLVDALPRLPDPSPAATIDLLGVPIARLMLDRSMRTSGIGPRLVLDALSAEVSVAGLTHLSAVSCDAAESV